MAKAKNRPKPADERIEVVTLTRGEIFGHPNTIDLAAAVSSIQILSKRIYDLAIDLPIDNEELVGLAGAVLIQGQLLASARNGLPNTDDDEAVEKIATAAFKRDAIERKQLLRASILWEEAHG
jgi:hypothetical protein